MDKKRKVPFGYALKSGDIAIDENEAKIVDMIFKEYLSGKSFLAISNILNNLGLRYSETANWNKSNVGRILKDSRYVGDDIYAVIMDKKSFNAVRHRIHNSSTRRHKPQNNIVTEIKGMLICESCNQPINCRDSHFLCLKCNSKARMKYDYFIEKAVNTFNYLISNINIIESPKIKPYEATLDTKRLENEINREIDKIDVDEAHINEMVLSLANIKYTLCNDNSYERMTKKIIKSLEQAECSDNLNIDLLKNIADKIVLHEKGDFFIWLKNGQKIE